ncbi:monothiol glutaredoxin-S17 isoform X1 [Physcomitrium patens]|uniref:Thioredoxin domain-containing protein n=2 Tax=Physcomitrium patens TaxID=3218 RepID=A9S689_PHYPA|nr:monothiol glutaredoxin-S17-like isoform X1 [Physcomitrium patens]XP_024387530.1 monothiol glutaredoxin-S17-like isoform X1 [Physcomitrium patens]PNR46293.1 hypothetical protein PHYPA_013412 [Physcomitrium patens]|eukprot:XP_024387528.1 monothiol glutaredoxin-S17-like isoform X1 [Physcomitrella patens]
MGVAEMAGVVRDANSKGDLDNAVKKQGSLVVVHFWASWCEPSKAMEPVFTQIAIETPNAQFFRVEAEEQSDISETYEVDAVPLFIWIKDGVVVDKMQGANAPELASKVAKWVKDTPAPFNEVKKEVPSAGVAVVGPAVSSQGETKANLAEAEKGRLHELVNSKKVMLFMKGSPEEPRCGFSRKVVNVLNDQGVEFGSFDILSDETVRQGMKTYANWPTFPQLYVEGELLGGCDIILEMNENGELKEVFAEKGLLPKETLETRLKNVINQSATMLFMKGTPDAPRCGFSTKVVNALKEEGIEFGSFNILEDEEVRQGLKTYSNWPTYPQLYYKGELLGGCDIILEMKASGELKSALTE